MREIGSDLVVSHALHLKRSCLAPKRSHDGFHLMCKWVVPSPQVVQYCHSTLKSFFLCCNLFDQHCVGINSRTFPVPPSHPLLHNRCLCLLRRRCCGRIQLVLHPSNFLHHPTSLHLPPIFTDQPLGQPQAWSSGLMLDFEAALIPFSARQWVS